MFLHRLDRAESPDRHAAVLDFHPNSLQYSLSNEYPSRPALCLPKTLVIIICCLVFCLGFSEFPETLNLSDDISNDFIVGSDLSLEVDRKVSESAAVRAPVIHPALLRLFAWDTDLVTVEALFISPTLLSPLRI